MFNWTTIHYNHSIQKCVKSFICSKYLHGYHDLDDMSMPIYLQCYSMCSKYSAISTLACLESCTRHLSMDASMTRCAMLSQLRLTDAVAIHCADVTSNDVNGSQKRNKSIKQKYLLIYHFETKLLCRVSWLTCMNSCTVEQSSFAR